MYRDQQGNEHFSALLGMPVAILNSFKINMLRYTREISNVQPSQSPRQFQTDLWHTRHPWRSPR
jgi:hypothetical protein